MTGQIAFEYPYRPYFVVNDNSGFVIVCYIGGNIIDKDILIILIGAGNRLDNQAAVTLKVVADNGNFLTIAATNMEGITAQSTHNLECYALTCALDKEAVVALKRVYDDALKS